MGTKSYPNLRFKRDTTLVDLQNIMHPIALSKNTKARFRGRNPLKKNGKDMLKKLETFYSDTLSAPDVEPDDHLPFGIFCKLNVTPSAWNRSLIVPINKIPDPQEPSNYRQISLTNFFRRIFEGSLLDFLSSDPKHRAAFSKLNHIQSGFRSGSSCILQAATLHDMIHMIKGLTAFIDLKQTFDRVIRALLYEELGKKNASVQVINILISLFEKCISIVVFDNFSSNSIARVIGLLQGSILSPILFNHYIDPLATKLKSIYNIIHQNKIPKSPWPTSCRGYRYTLLLQMCLDECTHWNQTFHIPFNMKKSKVILHYYWLTK
eukprot:Awhi_evm1s12074